MRSSRSLVSLAGGVCVGAFFYWFGRLLGWTPVQCWTAGVTALCAVSWVIEALPLAVTGLIPFALFPLLGVATPRQLAGAYGHPVIVLLLAGFLLSKALEHTGTHRRIALGMLHAVGGDAGRRLVFGFMVVSATLSMWISNSATALMLLPVAQAVLDQGRSEQQTEPDPLARPLLLGLAYAASIGGLGTPIGTPPNLVFLALYSERFHRELTFLEWMVIGVPAVVCLVPLAWWSLCRGLQSRRRFELPKAGPWHTEQRRVLLVFGLTALLWITRTAPYGGWQAWLTGATVSDGTVALCAVVALFIIPNGKGSRLLDWETAVTIPWGLLLLFSGGLAIATAFETSQLSVVLGSELARFVVWPEPLLIAAICILMTFLTEVTSNTATAALILPIIADAAIASGIDPLKVMIPATLSASCAFMLPVATAPNAIVFGSGQLSTRAMARAGFRLNWVGVIVITLLCVAFL